MGAGALEERPLALRVAAELCASNQDVELKVRALGDALRACGGDVDEVLAAAGLGSASGTGDPLQSAARAFHGSERRSENSDDAGSALTAAAEAVTRLRTPVAAATKVHRRPHSEPRRRPGLASSGKVQPAAQDAWQLVREQVRSPASVRRLQAARVGGARGTVTEEARRVAAAARGVLGKGQAAVLQHGSMRELRRWSADLLEALERSAEQVRGSAPPL